MLRAMTTRTATCRCGQLQARCSGEPSHISVCHCRNCQKRSGSAFAVQARWPEDAVTIAGEAHAWTTLGDSGIPATFHFCPTCGSTVYYRAQAMPGLVAVAVGAFADPGFPHPTVSNWEERKHAWVGVLGEDIEHHP